MDKSALSDEGRELYDEHGYHELSVAFLHDDYEDEGMPFYMYIDFVLDDELTEKFKSFDDEDRYQFLTKNRLRELLNKGYVIEVYDGEPVVDDVDDLNENLDKIETFS